MTAPTIPALKMMYEQWEISANKIPKAEKTMYESGIQAGIKIGKQLAASDLITYVCKCEVQNG
jgi:hypothetical protein